ncbi:trypsin-like peptidase domain-containing protein [Agrobacterium burrii]|uniref:Trypsin-like peptidase domain-containing protein n=1 Tax=Agrobacterium burrii TaxID=2815339 RepID=A0ABS3ECG5_9HYPH|nr:trypsin-like peptidase domain-containing protein [Agrobacterium burrii]MBO0129651.1 trypsin-like peptidase domain-containing protein [Agrobacterium burrii]
MSFPVEPDFVDERGLFVVQDPFLRSTILPLFSFDPNDPEQRPQGHGTAFRVDPWGCCATAFHVIEDLLIVRDGSLVLKADFRLAALAVPPLTFGTMPVTRDHWKPFLGMSSLGGIHSPPFQEPRVMNMTELASIWLSSPDNAQRGRSFLHLDGRWRPRIGERVMALGFAGLDLDTKEEGDDRAIRQYLYGSVGEISEVNPVQPNSSRPWPNFRVEANWPGGMSGGPVFNEAGDVVGLVSTGLVGGGIGTATPFAGWNVAERQFPTVDFINPGRLKCWIGLSGDEDIVACGRTREELIEQLGDRQVSEVKYVSLAVGSEEYISIPNDS